MPGGNLICSKCGRSKRETEFFKMKTGERCSLCKSCLTMYIDNRKPETFLWILEMFDVPYIEHLWIEQTNKTYLKDPQKFGPGSVIGKYIRGMNMAQYCNFSFADSDKLNKEYYYEVKPSVDEAREKELKEKYDNGEISFAMYQTLSNIAGQPSSAQEPTPREISVEGQTSVEDIADSEFVFSQEDLDNIKETQELEKTEEEKLDDLEEEPEVEENESIEEEPLPPQNDRPQFIPDLGIDEGKISDELTEEDIKYLMVKWGINYRPSEWVKLEEQYQKYASEYELNADREDILKKICKVSLKMDRALDVDDFSSFQKLSATFDSLRKSGKFTEAQNKEEETRDLDSIGELVAFVEREGGIIPEKDNPIEYPQDKVDFTIKDMQNYVNRLVRDELGLGELIESYIEKAGKQKSDSVEDIMHSSFEEEEVTEEEQKSFQDFLMEEIENESFRLAEGDF